MGKIAVILVTFNRLKLLKEALDAIEDLREDINLYIIDNNSNDGTKEYLEERDWKKPVQIYHLPNNIGGAGGFWYGLSKAMDNPENELFWVMDDDTIVNSNSLKALLEAREHHPASFYSSMALWTDGTLNKMNAQPLAEKDQGQNCLKIKEATFVSLLVDRKILESKGLPIPEFFIWGDDIEFTRRISTELSGLLVKDSTVLHKTDTNVGSDISKDKKERLARYNYAYRNEVFTAKREGVYRRFRQFAKLCYHSMRVIANSPQKMERLKIVWKGSMEGLRFHPTVPKHDDFEYLETKLLEIPKEEKNVHILEVFGEPFAYGGQESIIMNMYRHFGSDRVHMDFLTPFSATNKTYIEEIEKRGDHIYAYNKPFQDGNNRVFRETLTDFLEKHPNKYNIIHIHSGSAYALMIGSKIAAKAGIPVRIAHSHSCGFENWRHKGAKFISKYYFDHYTTDFASCSELAWDWKFPESKKSEMQIFKNAVDLDLFDFDKDKRERIRKAYGVEDCFVLGHVGRFSEQKNHSFLIHLFAKYYKGHPDARLWLIGDGEKKQEIEDLVKNLGLQEVVTFFGIREDVSDFYQAMDTLVLPSYFEGLPVVGVEALASGLPILCSDLIAHELPIPELTSYISLQDEKAWIKELDQARKVIRQDRRQEMMEAGYEVNQAAQKLYQYYLGRIV